MIYLISINIYSNNKKYLCTINYLLSPFHLILLALLGEQGIRTLGMNYFIHQISNLKL
jgi:uncharacterized membrane protein YciS (DUF1049 family)